MQKAGKFLPAFLEHVLKQYKMNMSKKSYQPLRMKTRMRIPCLPLQAGI